MNNIFCIATLIGKVLCLVVFVSALRPDHIGVIQTSARSGYCKTERGGTQGCGLNVIAAAKADVGSCSARPGSGHC
jgi:hypothetical protein